MYTSRAEVARTLEHITRLPSARDAHFTPAGPVPRAQVHIRDAQVSIRPAGAGCDSTGSAVKTLDVYDHILQVPGRRLAAIREALIACIAQGLPTSFTG